MRNRRTYIQRLAGSGVFGKKKPQSLRLKEETNLRFHTATLEGTKAEIDDARMMGLNAVERINSLEKNLITEQNKHAKINQHIADLRKELETAEKERTSIENIQQSIEVETLAARTEKQVIGAEFNQNCYYWAEIVKSKGMISLKKWSLIFSKNFLPCD